MSQDTEVRDSVDPREAVEAMVRAHSEAVNQAQQDMQNAIEDAKKTFEGLVTQFSSSITANKESAPAPAAAVRPVIVWQEHDGQRYLVMNEVAAKQQLEVFDKLAAVLPDLQDVVAPRGQQNQANLLSMIKR